MKNLINYTDWKLLFLYLALTSFGILNVYSVSSDLGQKQLVWAGISVVFLFLIAVSNLIVLELYSLVLYVLGIILLLGLFVVGKEINGAKAWYTFGSFSFQPAEFVKLFVAIFLSYYAHSKFEYTISFKNLLVGLVIIGIPALLILLQPDFGSFIIFSAFLIPFYREGLTGYIFLFILFAISLFIFSLMFDSFQVISVLLIVLSIFNFSLFKSTTSREKDIDYNLYYCFSISSCLVFVGFFVYSILIKEIPHLLVIIGFIVNALTFYYIHSYQKESDKVNKNRILEITLFFFLIQSILFSVSYFSNTLFNELLKPHQKERLLVLFEGEAKYRDTSGYNLLYAKTAIGSGQFLGKGYKNGTITSGQFVPEQQTDYIFTTVGEEWGFVGSSLLIISYSLFIARIFALAENQKTRYTRFYGYSVGSIFLYHFMLNIAMVMGLFPTIGIPLPYFSYGGSSFLAFSIMFFVFLKLNYKNNSYLV